VTGATHGNGKTFKKVEKIQADKVKDVKYVITSRATLNF
jgi:hypothetical protein